MNFAEKKKNFINIKNVNKINYTKIYFKNLKIIIIKN